jgi:signal transduction histidine kinase
MYLASSLETAFNDVEGVFVMLPAYFDPSPDFRESREAISAFRSALSEANPPKIVCLSTVGAHSTRPNLLGQLRLLEQELSTLPIPITFLRPAWFMENFSWDISPARETGVVPSFLQPLDKRLPMVATEDVGSTAAELLLDSWTGIRVVELEEPARVSPQDAAEIMEQLLGREVRMEKRRAQNQLTESDTVSIISDMARTISHDMRHSLSAIYANAEFLERADMSAHVRVDLVREIQEVVLEMTERLDSLLQFACSGRRKPLVHEPVSTILEKAIAAVKSHPSGRNVSIRAGEFPLAEADIDAMSLQSAIYNLLLNACQAATRSVDMPVVEVFLVEVEQWLYITILDNGPGIPASVRETLFDPFVTMGKPNGTGLGLTLARRIAEEHGGSVLLDESIPKRTVFTLSLTKNRLLT